MTGLRITTKDELLRHWAAIGKAYLAEVHDYRPSKDGGLCVLAHKGPSRPPWRVCALDGLPFPYPWAQPGIKRALALAARIEALRLADGTAFDWNTLEDRSHRVHAARLADGTPLMQAVQAIAASPEFFVEDVW